MAARTLTDAAVMDAVRDIAWTRNPRGERVLAPEGLYGRRKMTALVRRTALPDASAGAVGRAMRTLGLAGVRRGKPAGLIRCWGGRSRHSPRERPTLSEGQGSSQEANGKLCRRDRCDEKNAGLRGDIWSMGAVGRFCPGPGPASLGSRSGMG